MSLPIVLGHVLEQGNAWIPLLTVGGIGVVVVFVLVVTERIALDEPGDLLLPVASVVLVAGLTGSVATADWLLDQGPWLVPAALVLTVALVASPFTESLTIARSSRTAMAVAGIAVVAGVAAYAPLDAAWFGEVDQFALDRDDATASISLVEAPDQNGRLVVEVTVEGGTIGDSIPATARPDDIEQEMLVRFYVNAVSQFPAVPAECASDPTCRTAQFELFVPADERLDEVIVEFLTADGVPFVRPLEARLGPDELDAGP